MATLRETLDETIQIYNKKLDATRYAMAGYDYSNVDHAADEAKVPDVDEAMRIALKKAGINNKDDLATAFKLEDIEWLRLLDIQTPYYNRKVETVDEIKRYGKGAYHQAENTAYAKPYKGFTFDDVYAVEGMFRVLPKNEDIYTTNYGFYDRWTEPETRRINEERMLEAEEKELNKKIKDYFNYSTWLFGWNPQSSEISVGDIEERIEMRRSLAAMIEGKDGLESADRSRLLVKWYFDNAEGNPNVNIWRNYVDRKYIA